MKEVNAATGIFLFFLFVIFFGFFSLILSLGAACGKLGYGGVKLNHPFNAECFSTENHD